MKKIAVFASGNGSNFQSVADAIKAGKLNAEIGLVVCDKEGAFVLERAKQENVEVFCFSPKSYPNKEAFETEILEKLREYEIEFIVLAGYMRLIGPTLLQAYSHRLVNIHPSILP